MKSTTLHRSSLTKEYMQALERSRLINMDMNDIPQYKKQETSKSSELDVLYRSIEKGLKKQPVKRTPAVYLTIGFIAGIIFMLFIIAIVGLSSMGMKSASTPSDIETISVPASEVKKAEEYTSSGLAEEKYEIKSGDTLDKIALKFYGKYDTEKIEQIQRINNINNPSSLQIGQVIIIPLASGQ